MKSLTHIIHAVYSKPWLIQPSMHQSIRTQLEQYIAHGQMPMLPEDDCEEDVTVKSLAHKLNSISVISIDGIIGKHLSNMDIECGGVDLDMVATALEDAVNDPQIKTIVLYFNSPGGTTTGVKEVAQMIAEATKVKEVIGYTDTLCASAAYYLASQCTVLYCSPSSDVGSIGVYSIYFDESVSLSNEQVLPKSGSF